MSARLLFTCEHGGNRVPREFRSLFAGQQAVLDSHRGYDRGALGIARFAARHFGAPLIASTVTRLLVELNRSLHHRSLFSEFTRDLEAQRKSAILQRYYLPYRRQVEEFIAAAVAAGDTTIHIGFHSFTPEWNGEFRRADIGLLYDPARQGERDFCHYWRQALLAQDERLRVRMNYPYLGKADGLTTAQRHSYPPEQYWGIELEVNAASAGDPLICRKLQRTLAKSLEHALVTVL